MPAPAAEASEADFPRLSWHDSIVYGLRFEVGDPSVNDWRSNLVLDIDYVVEWVRSPRGGMQFRVAPATLTFHDVTDLAIIVDSGDSGFQTALNELSIDQISREQVAEQKICLDQPYFAWRIALNLPRGGQIRFGASGFTQRLRSEPILCDQQRLPRERRR